MTSSNIAVSFHQYFQTACLKSNQTFHYTCRYSRNV